MNYLRNRSAGLCIDCKGRLKVNPLRILDCKQEKCIQIRSQAPQIIDHLCQECNTHFKGLLEILDELDIPYELNPYLVRGLDYYTKTVFELFSVKEEKKAEHPSVSPEGDGEGDSGRVLEEDSGHVVQDALVGGGRYDNLVRLIGGKDTPACGFAAGVERIVKHMQTENVTLPKKHEPVLFLAQLGDLAKKKSLRILEEMRKAKIPTAASVGRNSLKSQLNIADKLDAKFAIILGQEEVLRNSAILREMDSGSQETVALDELVEKVKKLLKK